MRILATMVIAMALPSMAFAKETKPADPDKKICRDVEETGSMFPKRMCNTAAEWAKIDERNRKDANRYDNYRRDNSALR